jgi:hypothetical protein
MSGLSLNLNPNEENGYVSVNFPRLGIKQVPFRKSEIKEIGSHLKNIENGYNPHPEKGYHIDPTTNSRECSELRDRAYGGDPDAQYSFAVRLIMKKCGTKLESENDWMDLLKRAASSGHENARRLYDFFDMNHGNNTYQYFILLRNNPAKLLKNILAMPERSAAAAASPAAASSLGIVLRRHKTEKNKAKKAALAAFVSSPESASASASASASSSYRSRPMHELSPNSQAQYRKSVRGDFAAAERAKVKSKSKKGGRTRRRHKKRTTRKR